MSVCKCALCEKEIEMVFPYSYKFIRYKSKYYHVDCILKKGVYTASGKPIDIEKFFDKTKEFNDNQAAKDKIDRYLKYHYNITLVPTYIYVELSKIYSGSYKGLNKKIDPVTLSEMFDRYIDYMDRIALSKGLYVSGEASDMDRIRRFKYDLAVLLHKYDKYIKEKEENIAVQNEIIKSQQEHQFIVSNVSQFVKQQSQNYKDEDLSDIIDEI